MKAVLLAAGEGTRLRPLTDALPKCLVPVLGYPLLEIWLSVLPAMGVREILINTSYMADDVKRFLSYGEWGAKLTLTHEERLLGTAGTLFANGGFLRGEDVIVIHADNVSLFDGAAFLSTFTGRPRGCVATMMTFDTDAPQTCGIVRAGAGGIIQEMHEKVANPPGRRANGAVYIFAAGFVGELLAGPECSDISTEVLPRLMGRMNEFYNRRYHRDIGSLDLYRKACAEMLARREGLPRAVSPAWKRFADHAAFERWQAAWQASGLKVRPCASLAEVEPVFEEQPDVILLESVTADRLDRLADLAARRTNTTFVPWKAVQSV